MPRDIVSICIYDAPSQVYLDIAFLGEEFIRSRLRQSVCPAGIETITSIMRMNRK